MRNYAFVVFGLCAAVGCGGGTKKGNGDLSVSGTPTGALTGKLRVVLAFGKPMVAKGDIGKPAPKVPLVIEPALPGEATWTDEQTLAFVPSASLPVSTKFVATVPAGTRAVDGSETGDAYRFEFSTERVQGTVEVIGTKERATKDQLVRLTFNHEVDAAQATQHCAFVSATGKQASRLAAETPARPAKTISLQPAAPLAPDTSYTLVCDPALRGVVGNLGLAEPISETLRTYGPLKYVGLEPGGTDIVPDESLRLAIAFTNPLAPPYQMKLEPAVPGFPQRCFALGEPAGLSCGVQLEPRTAYTLTIDASQKDEFGQTLGTPQTVQLRTTDAEPTISLESGYFVAELQRPVIPMWTRNVRELEVTAVEVTPQNLHLLTPLIDWWEGTPVDFKPTRLAPKTKKIAVTAPKNTWSQQSIGAAELVGGAPGPGMYYVEIGSKEVKRHPYEDGGREKVLVNFTDIGAVSKLSGTRGLVWATKLSTGKPLPGATVTVRDANGKVTFTGATDAEGVAVLPGSDKLKGAKAGAADGEDEGWGESGMRIYVQSGNDWTMLNPDRAGGLSPWNFNVSFERDGAPTKLRGFMHTDRGLYRPGDKVHVKGIARVTRLGEPLAPPGEGKKVKVEVDGPMGRTVMETEAKLSAYGGFWFDLALPGDARLGDYVIRARLEHGTFTREFSVEEYRVATFEVDGKLASPRIVERGQVDATVSAKYLYGAPLRGGAADITIHSRPKRVDFPQHEGYAFTDERRYDSSYYGDAEDAQTLVTEQQVALDQNGDANLGIAIGPNDVYSDSDLLVRASVASPSNEVISKTFTLPYFRSKTYFGIKSPGWFLEVKKPAKFQVLAVSPDGKPVDGPAKITITRRDWNCVWEEWGYRGSYACKDTTKTILEKTVTIAGGKPHEVEITPESGGDYWVVVEGANGATDVAAAAQRVYAFGDGGGSWRSDDSLTFDIVADKKEYRAGDTATLILQTDLSNASGLVTIERDGVIEKRLIEVTPTTKHLTIPITASHAPNVYVSVALVQGRTGDGARGKPRMRMGLVNLPVRPDDNRLTVSVETDKADYRPRGEVTATVKVTDAKGQPVAAEVSLTAADEGVLTLIGYETPDPVPTFYAPWGIGVSTATQLEYIRDIPGPNLARPATGGDAAGTMRSRFLSTALWTPGVVTNAAGIATVKFAAPDNLTAFRVMAVAADKGYRFGSADKRFTVSKPLQLHQALPRFVRLGDKLMGGVVVHNETGAAGTATVKLVADPRLTVAGGLERTVQLAKGARVPVLFEMTGAELGEAVLQFSASMGSERDAVELELPVQHPSPQRSQELASGATKTDASIPVKLPANAIASTAELVISVDPDGLAGIEDGLRELVGYPYGCLEQTTSKVIPMLAVRDLAESLQLEGLTGTKLEGYVQAGLDKIGRHQTAYGGFSLWPGGEPEAYYTAYALWGLHLAKQAGYRVDQNRIVDGLEYLRNDGKRPDTSRPWYDEHGDLGSQAFSLYVRAVLGDKDPQAATTLAANAKLPLYGKAFLARAIAAGVGAKDPAVKKLVDELGAAADAAAKSGKLIDETDDLDYYMSSSLRTTAIVLGTLVELEPKHAAIKPLVQIVMANRRKAPVWDTQQNLYALLGLTAYARSAASQAPSVAVTLGDAQVLGGTLGGKQRVRVASVPLPAAGGTLEIKPRGEVHYRVAVRYRQTVESLKGESKNLTIDVAYLDDKGSPKTSFKVGDVVTVRLTAPTGDDIEHLIMSTPLPAGFEALNTKLATVGNAGNNTKEPWGTYREMRDDRVSFAMEYAWRGQQTHEFMMRATSAGTFARPPAVAEMMYDPEAYASTPYATIEIQAK